MRNWLVAFFLLIIVTYPSSPVLYQLIPYSQLGFVFIIISLLTILLISKKEIQLSFNNKVDQLVIVSFILISIVLVLNFSLTKTTTAIRDQITLLTVSSFILFSKRETFSNIFNKYCYLAAILIFFSTIITLSHFADLINIDFWNVNYMKMNDKSPLMIRASEVFDYVYYFPFRLTIITQGYYDAIAGNQLNSFYRQPLLFTEPTYYWAYVMPLAIFIFLGKDLKNKWLSFIVLALGGILSWSIYGFITLVIIVLFFLSTLFISKKRILYVLMFTALLISIINLESIIATLVPFKLAEYTMFAEKIIFENVSFLGKINDESTIAYGILWLAFRYGVLGLFVYLIVKILILNYVIDQFFSWKSGVNKYNLDLVVSMLFVLIYSLKIPQIAIYNELLLLGIFKARSS